MYVTFNTSNIILSFTKFEDFEWSLLFSNFLHIKKIKVNFIIDHHTFRSLNQGPCLSNKFLLMSTWLQAIRSDPVPSPVDTNFLVIFLSGENFNVQNVLRSSLYKLYRKKITLSVLILLRMFKFGPMSCFHNNISPHAIILACLHTT